MSSLLAVCHAGRGLLVQVGVLDPEIEVDLGRERGDGGGTSKKKVLAYFFHSRTDGRCLCPSHPIPLSEDGDPSRGTSNGGVVSNGKWRFQQWHYHSPPDTTRPTGAQDCAYTAARRLAVRR